MLTRELDEIGLGWQARLLIYGISLLPFVGLVIGLSYAARRNAPTRRFGRQLLAFAFALHGAYLFCFCPTAAYWALSSG
jgi:hypothetical protein